MQSLLLSRAVSCSRTAFVARNARFMATNPPGPNSPPSTSKSAKAETIPPSPASLSLDFSPVQESQEQRAEGQTGAKSSKDSLSSIERKRRNIGRASLAMLGLGIAAGAVFLGRDWEEGELKSLKIRVEDAPTTRMGRTQARFGSMFDFFSKPAWDELLPPPAPPSSPYYRPYTLILSLDDLLVSSTWDREKGWRTAKRPGVDYFLTYLSQFYEIVVFTSQHSYTALPILEKLDPYDYSILYKLFRESTRSVNGTPKKDLSFLNRDLSKVVMLDTDPDHVSLQPENAVVVPKWKGNPRDKGLVAMIPFLESIAIYRPEDVRPILSNYQGKDIPLEYGKKEAELKAQFVEEWKKSGRAKSGGGLTLSGLFMGSKQESPVPLTYLEQKRKEAQERHRGDMEYLEQNKAQFDKMKEEQLKLQNESMGGNLFSILSSVGAPPPQLPPQQQQQQPKPDAPKTLTAGDDGKAVAQA
ncbi:HAD-like protein [Schizopora paradoxa]|uniref:Mitochondrial import inner membrane translocase subunit TIM50 n=1 Tax=Schizopora paradoxa TaxID=27342 RepID=A0A0H2R236_9AGAM|nr:HAD-like protein [Schizopora paradoxa]